MIPFAERMCAFRLTDDHPFPVSRFGFSAYFTDTHLTLFIRMDLKGIGALNFTFYKENSACANV